MGENCPRCNGTKSIPFKRKDGSIVPYAFLDCPDCYTIPVDTHHDANPGDFDYPMSDTFRGYSYQYCGANDPGVYPVKEYPEAEAQPPVSVPRQYEESLAQLKGQVLYLQDKMDNRKKWVKKYEAYEL